MELEDDRETDGDGGGDGFVLGRGDAGFHGRNPISRHDLLRFDFRQHGPTRLSRRGNDRLGGFAGGLLRVSARWQARSLIERLKVVIRPPHERERLRGGIGISESRDACVIEDLLAGFDRRAAHPARENRLAGDLGVGLELASGAGRVAHGLGRQDHQEPVDVGVLGRDRQRPGVSLGIGVAQDVDGIVVAPGRRQRAVECLH